MDMSEITHLLPHSQSASRTSLLVARGPTWFQQSAACSPWLEDNYADIIYTSYEILSVFSICFNSADESRGYFLSYKQQFKAHDDKINAVAFEIQQDTQISQSIFATCGNDRYIRTWKYSEGLYELDKQVCLRQDVVPATCAACHIPDRSYVLVGSLHGHIIVWESADRRVAGSPLIKKFEKGAATVCSWLPQSSESPNILAVVGFKCGDVCCYSYESSTISKDGTLTSVFRLHAHDFEVCGLTPVRMDAEGGSYFASSGRDSFVKVWSVNDTKCVYANRFSFRPKTANAGQSDPFASTTSSQGKAWLPIAATNFSDSSPPLLAFDARGSLFAVDCVDKPKPCEAPNELRHCSVVFSLLRVPDSPNLFISIGMDGRIIVWKCDHADWQALRPVASHVYLSGKVLSMGQASGACGPLAVGLADGNLLLLRNMAPPTPNAPVAMTRISPLPPSGSAFGISAMAWHPDPQYENLLAIGSSKGHVDVVDVTKPQKRARTCNNLDSCVYRVAWGPRLFKNSSTGEAATAEEARLFVYAICKGGLFILLSSKCAPASLSGDVKSLMNHASDLKLSDISFRRVNSAIFTWMVALGSVNGAVTIFGLVHGDAHPLPLSRFVLHKKCINALSWSRNPDRCLLAVASNHSYISVIDATDQSSTEPPSECAELTSCLATLEGHGNRVVGLEWSPDADTNLLLSSSYDCTATVWRVELGASGPIANYRNHFSRVCTCAWSVQQPDLVFTGEEFGYLAGWRPSEQTAKLPPASRKHRQPAAVILPLRGGGGSDAQVVEVKEDPEISLGDSLAVPDKPKKSATSSSTKQLSLLSSLFATPGSTDCAMLAISLSPPISLPSRLSVLVDFVEFQRSPCGFPEDRILPEFDLLHSVCGSRRRLLRFVESEALKHLAAASVGGVNRNSRLDAYYALLLWLGRAEVVQRTSVDLQYMPFWLMWALEMCLNGTVHRSGGCCLVEGEECADENDSLHQKVLQLRDASNEFNRASTLLVCGGRTIDAVRLLMSRGRAKEALVLFRLRLNPSTCPILLSECLALLADRQTHTGLPNSALAFLAAGQVSKAVDAVAGFANHSAPSIDHIAALSVVRKLCPEDHLSAFKLAHFILIYAAALAVDEERASFLRQWADDGHLYACGLFLLTEDSPALEEVSSEEQTWLRFAADRQQSIDEPECLAGLVVDFAVASVTGDAGSQLERSLDCLRRHHPSCLSALVDRLNRKLCNTSAIPSAFQQIISQICTDP